MASIATAAQCPYDVDGDGMVSGHSSELLSVLGAFGTSDPAIDFNANTFVGLEDVTAYLGHAGQPCPTNTAAVNNDLIEGLVIALHHDHTTSLSYGTDEIPAGSKTYRVYVQVQDENVVLSTMGSIDGGGLLSYNTGSTFQSDYGSSLASGISPLFFPTIPTLEYDTYLAGGFAPGETALDNTVILSPSGQLLDESWSDGLTFNPVSPYGEGWLQSELFSLPDPLYPKLRLVGQVTASGEHDFFLGMDVFAVNMLIPGLDLVGTTALANNLSVLVSSDGPFDIIGCTDPEATNYAPEATVNTGLCAYADITGDGVVDTGDIMALLTTFGCTTCYYADYDSNGKIDTADLMEFLAIFSAAQ